MLNGGVTTATGPPFTEADLRAAAGDRSFERGAEYLEAVAGLETIGHQVVATVRGTEDYLVVLTLGTAATVGGAGLRGECGCPYGQEGFFCKHCVAVGLAILSRAAIVPAPRTRARTRPDGQVGPVEQDVPADLSSWLYSRRREDLLALVFHQLLEDEDWRRRLELRAAVAVADFPAIRMRIASLLQVGDEVGRLRYTGDYGYLEGEQSWRYARRIREVTETVQQLAGAGQAGEAAAVAEHALTTIAASSRNASDQAGAIATAATELLASHRAACAAAPPDPERLAGFLAARMVSRDDFPGIELADYTDLLGPVGIALLRDRVTAAWQANRSGWAQRRAMVRVLTAAGDVDALVAVLASDLDEHGESNLRIARELDQAGRADEALAWAERGLRESSRPDPRLVDFVVGRYRSQGRILDATDVCRERFAADRTVAAYERLRAVAEQAGTWHAAIRDWALDLLRADASQPAESVRWPPGNKPGPVIVDALIAEGDIAAAWESARGVATDAQWLRLADLIAETRPADALAVYVRLIASLRKQTGEGVYERLARLLDSARACHDQLGTEQVFDSYLRAFRDSNKRRRRLIRILDAHHLQ